MGKSLGIDPLSDKVKVCNLNCIYCQLGKTHTFGNERKEYVPTDAVVGEVNGFFSKAKYEGPSLIHDLDYITFSGRGEPTLARNLGAMIRGVRKIRREKIAVITNSVLLHMSEVQDDLLLSDLVVVKLDACDELSFKLVDKAFPGIRFSKILEGIRDFGLLYQGKLAVQIMFVEENRHYVKDIAEIVKTINADEIQINTPLRPSCARPLNQEAIQEIKKFFQGVPATTVYEHDRKKTIPFDEQETIRRHGHYKNLLKHYSGGE